MSFKKHDLKIDFEDGGLLLVGQAALAQIQEQAAKGIAATGEETSYDWERSGRLLHDVSISQDGTLEFNAPYAGLVNQNLPFADIAPQSVPEYEQKLQPVIARIVIFKKE